MHGHPIRLLPGEDLRLALERQPAASGAVFVLAGIGSLSAARLRFAGDAAPRDIAGDSEILHLSGTIAGGSAHLHAAISMPDGSVLGGHVAVGCTIRTTAEVLLLALPDWEMQRAFDAATGYDELLISPRQAPGT